MTTGWQKRCHGTAPALCPIGGISHDASEHTEWVDGVNGANVLLGATARLARMLAGSAGGLATRRGARPAREPERSVRERAGHDELLDHATCGA
jgi:hypothetical protein